MVDGARRPRYSLVVMTYDRPRALSACLDSVAALDCDGEPPEVIVVDDGSAPPAHDVTAAYATRFPLVYDHRPNGGVAAARNRGLALASGDRIGFLADDYRLPRNYLRRAEAFFRDRPSAEVVSFDLRPTGPSRLRAVQALYMRLALAQQHDLRPDADGVVASFTLPASRAAVFRRAVFDRVGRFDESLRVGEDGDMTRRLAAHGIPVHLLAGCCIEHYEQLSAVGYLRQRVRYGRSFVRVLGGEPGRATLARFGHLGVSLCAARKMGQWWGVATRLGERGRYVSLAPLLMLFLSCFYLGALRELRESGEPA